MSGPEDATEGARRLERLYATPDVVAQRAATLDKLRLAKGQAVIDVGSGPGFLCESMADLVGPSGRVLGIDISAQLVELSARRNHRPWLSYHLCDATAIHAADASFDVLTCVQVVEFIPEVDQAIREAFRVLKPGGRALFVATDWDGVVWHSDAPARMAAVMKSWEAHRAHPRLPRAMPRHLRAGGFVLEEASIFPILNLEWGDGFYSKGIAGFIRDFVVKRGEVGKDVVDAWYGEFPRLSAEGRYFFSTGRVIFVASKAI